VAAMMLRYRVVKSATYWVIEDVREHRALTWCYSETTAKMICDLLNADAQR
jgi:hypothetical protein